jgi:hypothetical protein
VSEPGRLQLTTDLFGNESNGNDILFEKFVPWYKHQGFREKKSPSKRKKLQLNRGKVMPDLLASNFFYSGNLH